METGVNTPEEAKLRIHGMTQRVFVKCSEEEGADILRKLERGFIRATKSTEERPGLYGIELPAPMRLTEVEYINGIISQSSHAFSDPSEEKK